MLRPGRFEMLVVLQVPTNKQLSRGPQATMMPHGAACCWSLASPLRSKVIRSKVVPSGRISKKASPSE